MEAEVMGMRILTFDIEEWFHILDHASTRGEEQWLDFESRLERNVDRILGVLEGTGSSATFFCLGWIAEKYPHVIRRISSLGYEVASHSYAHQLVYEQSREEFEADLERSVKVLEDAIGSKVLSYRAPGFSITPSCSWAFEVLAGHGIEVDCSVFPAMRAHGGFPGFVPARPTIIETHSGQIKEFPQSVYRLAGMNLVFSGGGYFRLLPYAAIKSLTMASEYVMTYFHPRDFDPSQPVIKDLSLIRKFKSYYGLGSAEGKLRRLLDDFDFVSLEAAMKSVDWESGDLAQVDI